MAIKLRVCRFWETRGIPAILLLNVIEQRTQRGTGTRVVNDALPRRITVQLGKQRGQTRDKFFSFPWRECPNRGFNFLHRAHSRKLRCPFTHGKADEKSSESFAAGHLTK